MHKFVRENYEKAYNEHADAIFRYCYLRVSNREKAKDIMQDTFIKAWEYMIKNTDVEILNIRAFLYKSAGHLIIDDYRKKKMSSLDELQEGGFDVPTDGHRTIVNSAELGKAMEAVEKLEPKYRDVFIMRHVDDMSPKEIAELTGETENNVSVKINRASKKLKEILNNGK